MILQRLMPLISIKHVYPWLVRLSPYCLTVALFCVALGAVAGLFWAPMDYQQGDAFRLIYIHVPSAFLSLMVYAVMAFAAFMALVFRIKIYGYIVQVSPMIGATFTLIALLTGAIWGKPMWGTWWIWDARLTSELILLFIYIGIMALGQAISHPEKALKAMCLLTLVGALDLPIIHYSVYWWQTLHQGATLSLLQAPKIDPDMLWPLLLMLCGFVAYYFWLLCVQLRAKIIVTHCERESVGQWLEQAS